MTIEQLKTMSDEQLATTFELIKKEQQYRKDEQKQEMSTTFKRKLVDLIDYAKQMEMCGIGVELEISEGEYTQSYCLDCEDLDIVAHTYSIYKSGE